MFFTDVVFFMVLESLPEPGEVIEQILYSFVQSEM